MASLLFALLFLAMAAHSSATWCIYKEGMSDSALQKTLDYACGNGADCTAIHQNGPCFNPNTVRAHCNYAVNSFFQRKGQAAGTCDFASTASITTNNPSITGCVFPASASGTTTPGTSTTPTMPSTGTPSSTTTSTGGYPIVTTPTGGGTLRGGINNGLSPSGAGSYTDMSHGGISMLRSALIPSMSIVVFSALAAAFWLE